ncbi:hypothetical protein JOC47_002976 [Halanaerobacter jeridensis]|uniref:Uncharacterized protein n=1 Tax=Halanaerobacter jeridensis TaxID=706427 RepID=A0A938XUN3_9FIRM|nr:hypothetical protein [Halanaerobacter jeridensis]
MWKKKIISVVAVEWVKHIIGNAAETYNRPRDRVDAFLY